jgi:hypothetical protein
MPPTGLRARRRGAGGRGDRPFDRDARFVPLRQRRLADSNGCFRTATRCRRRTPGGPSAGRPAVTAAESDARYTAGGFEYDDVRLGFDLEGSALSLRRVREMDGQTLGNSKRLGYEASWGKFENLLRGRTRRSSSTRTGSTSSGSRRTRASVCGRLNSRNDVGQEPVDVDLGELLKPARNVWAA